MRRIALSRLKIVQACPGSHRDDTEWPPEKESYEARAGKAFHDAIEMGSSEGLAAKYKLTPRQEEKLANQLANWKRWADRSLGDWRPEVAYGYNPETGAVRTLPRDVWKTDAPEMYGRVDALGFDPWFADWKSGGFNVPPPKQNPQMWGLAPIVALANGWDHLDALILQVPEEGDASPSRQTFSSNELAESAAKLLAIHRSVTPDAPYVAGDQCRFCRAKPLCPTYAAYKAEQDARKEPEMSNVKPIRKLLTQVKTGRVQEPVRVLGYGMDKVGKSTFAAGAPRPIFIGPEGGTAHLDIARFPVPQAWADVIDAVSELTEAPHDYLTLVVDPVNWLEPLVFDEVNRAHGKSNIEEVGGGFQKGYVYALDHWKRLLSMLDVLRAKRSMHVLLMAHAAIKNQKNPEGTDFDRYQLSMDARAAAALRQWVDAVLFMRHEQFTKVEGNKAKGKSTDMRVIHTQWSAAWDAGNRYSLPEELPLSWPEFWAAVEKGRHGAEELRARALALATELGGDTLEKLKPYLAQCGDDVAKLNEAVNVLVMRKGA